MPKLNQRDFNDEPVKYVTEKHVACVFLLDTSSSMNNNEAIKQLNEGLRVFKQQTLSSLDTHAKACIDVAVVTFDSYVNVIQDFAPVEEMELPELEAYGNTAMGEALETAMDMVATQKNNYKNAGTPYFRPWIFCITDGGPTDDYREPAERLKYLENNKKVVAYCVGVDGFRADIMKQIFDPNNIYGLKNCDFRGLFKFVSDSMRGVANSTEESGSLNIPAPDTMFKVPLD